MAHLAVSSYTRDLWGWHEKNCLMPPSKRIPTQLVLQYTMWGLGLHIWLINHHLEKQSSWICTSDTTVSLQVTFTLPSSTFIFLCGKNVCMHWMFLWALLRVCVLGFVCVRPQADGQGDAELKQDWKRGPVSFPSKPPSSVFTMQPDVSLRTHSAPWLQSSEWTTQFTALFIFSIQHAQSAAHFWIDTFSQCWCVHPCCTITAVFQTFASA